MDAQQKNPGSLFSIQDQTAIVTGGSGGLGLEFSLTLARAGARVAILSQHQNSADRAVASLKAEGFEALGLACDVQDKTLLVEAAQKD